MTTHKLLGWQPPFQSVGFSLFFPTQLPQHGDLWSCYVDMDTRRMDSWEKMLGGFTYSRSIPFFDMIVPTMDTVRYGYLMTKLLAAKQSVLFTGLTGVGKVSRLSLSSFWTNKIVTKPLFWAWNFFKHHVFSSFRNLIFNQGYSLSLHPYVLCARKLYERYGQTGIFMDSNQKLLCLADEVPLCL